MAIAAPVAKFASTGASESGGRPAAWRAGLALDASRPLYLLRPRPVTAVVLQHLCPFAALTKRSRTAGGGECQCRQAALEATHEVEGTRRSRQPMPVLL